MRFEHGCDGCTCLLHHSAQVCMCVCACACVQMAERQQLHTSFGAFHQGEGTCSNTRGCHIMSPCDGSRWMRMSSYTLTQVCTCLSAMHTRYSHAIVHRMAHRIVAHLPHHIVIAPPSLPPRVVAHAQAHAHTQTATQAHACLSSSTSHRHRRVSMGEGTRRRRAERSRVRGVWMRLRDLWLLSIHDSLLIDHYLDSLLLSHTSLLFMLQRTLLHT